MGLLLNSFSRLSERLLPKGSTGFNAVLVVLGDGIFFTSAIITSMILARIITLNDMATYRQVIYLGLLVQRIIDFGLSASIYRFWNLLDNRGRSTYIKMQLTLSMGLGLLGSIALATLSPFLADLYHNPDLKIALWICAASPLVNIVPLTIRPVMICRGRPLAATLTQMFFSLAMILAIIIPFTLGANLNTALIYWMVVNVIEVGLTFLILMPEFVPGTPFWDKVKFKETWDYLWPIQVGRLPGVFTLYTDKIATSIFLSVQAFAAYSTGAREIPFVGNIGGSISSVLIPSMVIDAETGNVESIFKRWKKACEWSALATYPLAGFCVWFSLPIVQFLYSSKYVDSAIPFAVFAAITFIRVVEFGSLAKAFGKTAIILKSSAASALVMIVLSFPLTAWFGVWGISLAVLLSVLTANGYCLWAYTKLFNVSLSVFFPWKRLLLLVGISIASAAIAGSLLDPFLKLSDNVAMATQVLKLILMFSAHLVFYGLFLVFFRMLDIRSILTLLTKSKQ